MIVTFYSYKGGVGRSFCLSNLAVILARWGYHVLCVDWDLEAPGLHHYFAEGARIEEFTTRPGVVDLVRQHARSMDADWGRAAIEIELRSIRGALSLVTAGRQDDAYAQRAQSIDWEGLYRDREFGQYIEDLRAEWAERYDVVLVDSRTGITDIGGICTAQLPDMLVTCFVANNQSLRGAIDVARRAAEARNRLPFDRFRALTLPILSRLDSREEYKTAQLWQGQIASAVKEFYDEWAPDSVDVLDLVERTTVPYVPVWSFGERLPAAVERASNPEVVSHSLETIASLIAHGLAEADLLTRSRDEYVARARALASRRRIGQTAITESDDDPQVVPIPPPTRDDAASVPSISLVGAPGSGKTTMLAVLPIAASRSSVTVLPDTEISSDYLHQVTNQILLERRFPPGSMSTATISFRLVGDAPSGSGLARLLGRRSRDRFHVTVQVLDPPGMAFSGDQELDVLSQDLARSRGIVYLFDPTAGNRGREPFSWLQDLVRRLDSVGGLQAGRLPHYMAVCITKFDDEDLFRRAIRSGLVRQDADTSRMPFVPDKLAKAYFDWLCDELPSSGGPVLRRFLQAFLHPDRIAYFVTSAIGFRLDEQGRFDMRDFKNLDLVGGESRVRDEVRPINVIEPFRWLAREIARGR